MTTATRTTRQLPARALLAGGLAAFVSSFLPFSTMTYPPDFYASSSPVTWVSVPARDLIIDLQTAILNEYLLPKVLILAFLIWGIPLILVALGAVALGQHRGRLQATVYFVGLLLLLIGAGNTLVTCIFYESYRDPWFGSLPTLTHSLEIGSLLTLLGYLSAFVALVWLCWSSRRMRSERNSMTLQP
jgi:hypothetical protein